MGMYVSGMFKKIYLRISFCPSTIDTSIVCVWPLYLCIDMSLDEHVWTKKCELFFLCWLQDVLPVVKTVLFPCFLVKTAVKSCLSTLPRWFLEHGAKAALVQASDDWGYRRVQMTRQFCVYNSRMHTVSRHAGAYGKLKNKKNKPMKKLHYQKIHTGVK